MVRKTGKCARAIWETGNFKISIAEHYVIKQDNDIINFRRADKLEEAWAEDHEFISPWNSIVVREPAHGSHVLLIDRC